MIGGIGSKELGDVILFEVSDQRVLTLFDFQRSNSVRFAKNDVLLRKPVSQYVGPELDKITMKIILKAQLVVNPKKEMDKLITVQREGRLVSIILGKTPFGVYRWRIAELGIPFEVIDNTGFCVSSTVDVSCEEYV
jgi:phage protein U